MSVYLSHVSAFSTRNTETLPWLSSFRADSRFAPSQWETTLLCNDVSHWLGTRLEWTLSYVELFLKLNTPPCRSVFLWPGDFIVYRPRVEINAISVQYFLFIIIERDTLQTVYKWRGWACMHMLYKYISNIYLCGHTCVNVMVANVRAPVWRQATGLDA